MPGEAYYDGTHSITFSNGDKHSSGADAGHLKGKNTWKDWHLIPTEQPVVAEASVNTNLVDIPGRNGQLDMTTFLTGGPTYASRSGSWEFMIDNGWEADQEVIRRAIADYIHGKQKFVVLEDDPTRFWAGRFSLEDFRSGASNHKVTINYVLNPFTYELSVADNWEWDPFNFETDYTDGRQNSGTRSL